MGSSLDRYREQFRADPDEKRAFEALEEGYFLSGSWSELIELYGQRLAAPSLRADPLARAPVLFRLAQIWEERRGDGERALEYYTQVVRADASYRPALRKLRALHEADGRWEVALQIGDLEAEVAMPAEERGELLAEIGGIWLERLAEPEQALAYFEQALS